MSYNKLKPATSDLSFDQAWGLLESAGWLAARDARKRRDLRTIARRRTCEPGDYLYHAGDTADGVYGLVRGTLDILIPRLDGEEQLVHRAEPGFWVGDLALFARQQRLIGVRAAARSDMVYLPQDQLRRLIRQDSELIADFYMLTHANMTTALQLLGTLAVPGAEKRLALRLLLQSEATREDDGWIHLSQECLAEFVALSPQSVRRALHGLKARGLIDIGYGKFRIVDREALAILSHYPSAKE